MHCAVGELIRRYGHPDLTQSIDDRFECALVEDIDNPEFAGWAESHG